jgi:hypothetical protein
LGLARRSSNFTAGASERGNQMLMIRFKSTAGRRPPNNQMFNDEQFRGDASRASPLCY